MPEWLNRLAERGASVENLDAWRAPDRPCYVILDQHRAPVVSRQVLYAEGYRECQPLFAGTSLEPLMEDSPWCLIVAPGSVAWRLATTLCAEQRLGWVCQPPSGSPADVVLDVMQPRFILQDSHGGRSLVNLQDPAVWTALLGSVGDSALAAWLSPLGRVATPTPQGSWWGWCDVPPADTLPLVMSVRMEQAMRQSPRAWWLSQATRTPLPTLPPLWLERLLRLIEAGISKPRHLERLLPPITQEPIPGEEDWWMRPATQDTLHMALPPSQKVDALARLESPS